MSVYEKFYGMIGIDLTGAYEAPVESDILSEVEAENERINSAGDPSIEENMNTPSDGEDTYNEEEQPVEETTNEEIPSEGEEYVEEESVEGEEMVDESQPVDDNSDNTELEYQKKVNVHKNTRKLLAIMNLSRDAFEQKFSNHVNGEYHDDYHKIIKCFDDMITITNNVLIEKFSNGDYNTLIRHYVSLTKVYDLVTRMVEKFVDDHIKENDETKS